MSAGEVRLPWEEAMEIARAVAVELQPHVRQIKVAGSLRRRKPSVGDIEIVCEPHLVPAPEAGGTGNLFGEEAVAEPAMVPDLAPIRQVLARWGQKRQDGERKMSRVLAGGATLEVWLVHPPAQWGSILAIRTGPRELGTLAVTRMKDFGLQHVDGHVVDEEGRVVPTPTEEDFFRLAGLPCVAPEERAYEHARKPLPRGGVERARSVPAPAPAAPPATPGWSGRDVLIVDLSNLLARAWYTLRNRTLEELPGKVAAMLQSVLRRHPHRHLFAAIDAERSWVADVVPGYKADRASRRGDGDPSTAEMAAALRPWLGAWGIAIREADGAEADHVIGALALAAAEAGRSVSILSRDTDLLALVDDAADVQVLWPAGKGDGETVMDEAAATAQAGVPPHLVLDFRILAGGKDGLPRVEGPREGKKPWGFTERRATELLAGGATLESVLAGEAELEERERAWLTPDVVAAARARYAALDLRRRDLALSAAGQTHVGRIDWSARPAAGMEAPPQVSASTDPTPTARCAGGCGKDLPLLEGVDPAQLRCTMCRSQVGLVKCAGNCGAMIPDEPSYNPLHCQSCAAEYMRRLNAAMRERRAQPQGDGPYRPAGCCPRCGGALDLLALTNDPAGDCTSCRLTARGEQARGRRAA